LIGLDTNILVRLLVEDDLEQGARALRAVAKHCSAEQPGYVGHIVLCELIWVLEARYRFGRAAIVAAVEALSRSAELRLQEPDLVRAALDIFASGRADFADCLIGLANLRAGGRTTLTLDRAAGRLPAFEAV